MKRLIIPILFIAFAFPCSAQWKDAKFGDQILAFGVHNTSFFVGSVPYNPNDPLVFRFDPTNPSLWDNADSGIDRSQGNITSFASLGNYVFAGSHSARNGPVYPSTNNGSQWGKAIVRAPIYSNGVYLFGTLLSAYGSHLPNIVRSKNSGTTWDSVFNVDVNTFASIGICIFADTGNGILRSTDTGNTWSPISPPFVGVMTVMGSLLFIPGNGELAESTDNGTQWTTVAVDSAGVPKNVQCLATDGKNLFAGTPTGVLVSTDTGRDWQAENDGLLASYKDISAIGVFDTLLFIDVSNIGPSSNFDAYYRPIREMVSKSAVASSPQPSDTISIYPNPAIGTVTILSGGTSIYRVSIVNMLGEKVLDMPHIHESNITLDLSKLPSETYFLQIETANGSVLRKVVVQH